MISATHLLVDQDEVNIIKATDKKNYTKSKINDYKSDTFNSVILYAMCFIILATLVVSIFACVMVCRRRDFSRNYCVKQSHEIVP